MEKIIFVLIKFDGRIFIMADDKFNISAFTSVKSAIKHFESEYDNSHVRSYEASMSACMHFIQFQPRIVVAYFDVIKNEIAAEEPRGFELNCISGFMKGITTREGVEKFWEEGKAPRLIKENHEILSEEPS